MDPWSNIECKDNDPEIRRINQLEGSLGVISDDVRKIRELITGFEVCHFKFISHLNYISKSIVDLKPVNILENIGKNHIRHGEMAARKDDTGRSLRGLQYIQALKAWLENRSGENGTADEKMLVQQVRQSLGRKTREKERLVRLLIARLMWDWKSYEAILHKSENKDLEFQVCRMDICHYAFPGNLDSMLEGIGRMKPVEPFHGCGTVNPETSESIKKEFTRINNSISIRCSQPDEKELTRVWLYACMAKTLKEQAGLKQRINIS
jgi:hypothetical protein